MYSIIFGSLLLGILFVYMNIDKILVYFTGTIVKLDFINLIEQIIEEIKLGVFN